MTDDDAKALRKTFGPFNQKWPLPKRMLEYIQRKLRLGMKLMLALALSIIPTEYIPTSPGCVTTVVIQPDGKRLICTTCPTGAGQAVTICQ